MKNLIIGTAGHVDHGKTTLIKALTGVDTDRLKEEKERGITIELGFAHLTLPTGERCGIIDVPGHEKFVRNMLAGAGSVDLALFVVAADEGIMPQSREHLEILTLLGIKRGIIALTKCDSVEQDWLDLVIEDVKTEVKDTFLKSSQIIPVSAKTGEGIDTLKTALFNMILADCSHDNISVHNTEGNCDINNINRDLAPFRLPVDRVFTKEGFGTVVTGTLTDGQLSVGEEVTLFPNTIKARVRSLQVHSKPVEKANRGQRVAVNLASIKTEEVSKGCVLAEDGSMRNSDMLDVRLDIVKSTSRKILNNSRLHFFYGTDDVLCKVVLLNKSELLAGESCYAQLRLERPAALRMGDRFVVRFYSPTETVGGGVVLDANPLRRHREQVGVARMFEAKEKGNLKERVLCFILDKSKFFPLVSDLRVGFLNNPQFNTVLSELASKKEVFLIRDSVIHKDFVAVLAKKCKEILNDFHKNNPLLEGMKKEELKSKLFSKTNHEIFFDDCVELLRQAGAIKVLSGVISDIDFKVVLNDLQKRMSNNILLLLKEGGFAPPSVDELLTRFLKEQRVFKQALDALVAGGEVVMLTPQIAVSHEYYNKALQAVGTFLGEFTLAQFRDNINSSRKFAVAFLEHFDAKGITKKQGDYRVLKT